MNKTATTLLLACLLLLGACHRNGEHGDILSHEQMVDFLAEAYLIEGFYVVESSYDYKALSPESLGAYNSLLDRLGVTREQIEQSIDYYSLHPEEMSEMHDEAIARIEAEYPQTRPEKKPMPTINVMPVMQ